MILSNASLISSAGRLMVGLKHLAVALAVVAFASGTASAEFFTFQAESNNNHVTIGLNQLSMEVLAVGTSQVSFTFKNQGTENGSITDIYFYDGTLLAPKSDVIPLNPTITDSGASVSFDRNADPNQLPDYNGPVASLVFTSDSANPAGGVDQDNEWVTFTFNLLDGVDFQDILDGLALGNPTSGLVVGIHFTAAGPQSSASNSYTNNPYPVVPEPASIVMLGMSSVVGLGYAWRKRKTAGA